MSKRRSKGTGSIFQTARGTWRAVYTYRDEGDRQQRKTWERRTRTLALAAMNDYIAGVTIDTRQDWTLDQLGRHLLADDGQFEKAGRQSSNTRKNYLSQWEIHVAPTIGYIKLPRLQVAHLDECVLRIWGQEKRRTAQAVRNLLHLVLTEGRRLKLYKGSIEGDIVELRYTAHANAKATIFSLEQMLALIEFAEGHWIQAPIVLAGILGMRRAEIAGLTWPCLNLEDGWIEVARQYQNQRGGGGSKYAERTKTDAGWRKLPLPAVAIPYLAKLKREGLPVFPSARKAGMPVDPSTLYHELQKLVQRYNKAQADSPTSRLPALPTITFHELRHSANNILKQLGVPATVRRDILGHSDIRITENIYTQTVDPEIVQHWKTLEAAAAKILTLPIAEEQG